MIKIPLGERIFLSDTANPIDQTEQVCWLFKFHPGIISIVVGDYNQLVITPLHHILQIVPPHHPEPSFHR